MAEQGDRDGTVRMRPEDLPDPTATQPERTRVASRVPAVDAPEVSEGAPARDGIDSLSDPYFSPAAPADLTTARQVIAIESPVESLPERKRRLPRWAIVLFAILALAAAAGIAYLTYENEVWGGRSVPEVVGLTEEDARAKLESGGFAVDVEYRAGDGDYGTVLSCSPQEGARIDPSEGVTLVVAGERVIPSVLGLSEEEATAALYDAGASEVLVTRQSSDEPAGTVLVVDPAEGSPFVSTDQVTLTVAQPYVVPEVEGMTVSDALALLEEAGLSGSVTYVESDADKNQVVSSDPVAGAEVAGGSSVTLSVSSPFPSSPTTLLDYFEAEPAQVSEYLADEGFSLRYSAIYVSDGNARCAYESEDGDVLQISDAPESGHYDGSTDGDVLARGAGIGGLRFAFSAASLPDGAANETEEGVRAVMEACGFEGMTDLCTQDDAQLPQELLESELYETAHFVCATGRQDGYTWVVRIGGVGESTGVVAMVAPTAHFSAVDLSSFGGSVCDYVAYIDLFTG